MTQTQPGPAPPLQPQYPPPGSQAPYGPPGGSRQKVIIAVIVVVVVVVILFSILAVLFGGSGGGTGKCKVLYYNDGIPERYEYDKTESECNSYCLEASDTGYSDCYFEAAGD